ncbi:hypothetical protein RSOLAG1IB_12187 [Rhizoctonia solani AG-1 IB]|uniref:Uncharacterized protein n=1 Tax=Thanatephorus cucumeris (strain AG1-IB / isolate 7/3/14) TaxID=1108050 RepID=A0A0B7FRD0_THACB|nr:hypothetical protein RSOLAG1IB_12187 [Rhizoctonia solani AG-1 IB]
MRHTPISHLAQMLKNHSRQENPHPVQLRIDHFPVASYHHRFKKTNSSLSPRRETRAETSIHFLMSGQKLDKIKQDHDRVRGKITAESVLKGGTNESKDGTRRNLKERGEDAVRDEEREEWNSREKICRKMQTSLNANQSVHHLGRHL